MTDALAQVKAAVTAVLDFDWSDSDALQAVENLNSIALPAIDTLGEELARLREMTGAGLTLGGGHMVHGTIEAINRAQTLLLIDSTHPVEKEDVRRSLVRDLQRAETNLAELREFIEMTGTGGFKVAARSIKQIAEMEAKLFDAESALADAKAALREATAELVYLREYGHLGAKWEANESKDVWRTKADAALGEAPAPAGETGSHLSGDPVDDLPDEPEPGGKFATPAPERVGEDARQEADDTPFLAQRILDDLPPLTTSDAAVVASAYLALRAATPTAPDGETM